MLLLRDQDLLDYTGQLARELANMCRTRYPHVAIYLDLSSKAAFQALDELHQQALIEPEPPSPPVRLAS